MCFHSALPVAKIACVYPFTGPKKTIIFSSMHSRELDERGSSRTIIGPQEIEGKNHWSGTHGFGSASFVQAWSGLAAGLGQCASWTGPVGTIACTVRLMLLYG